MLKECNNFWNKLSEQPNTALSAPITDVINGESSTAAVPESNDWSIEARSQSDNVTSAAEGAAETVGSESNPEQTQQECRGWIAVKSHYLDFDLLSVGCQITVSRLVNGAARQVAQEEVNYNTIATNDLFVSRRPVARPTPVEGTLEGAPVVPVNASQAQEADIASDNGNPQVLLGGEEGFEPGEYRVTVTPNIAHGKLRVDPEVITQAQAEAVSQPEMAGRYKIIQTDGEIPDGEAIAWTNENTTDQYLQVDNDTTAESEWSQDVTVDCRSRNNPSIVEFHWVDFSTWDNASNTRIRTLHPEARNIFFTFINKIEETFDRDFRVAQAHRTFEEQNRLYAQGRTQPGNIVTNARGGRSNHNYGVAVDIFEVIAGGAIDWNADYDDAVTVGDALGLEWGGRWTTIVDRPHFQMDIGLTTTQLLNLYNNGDTFTYDGYTYVEY